MPGVASPCLLRFQGLITLLAAFSSQPSETLIEPQAFLGFSPSEVYSPQRAQPLSRPFTLLPFNSGCMALHLSEPGLQSLSPFEAPFSGISYQIPESILSWGFVFGVFIPCDPFHPLRGASSSVLFRQPPFSRRQTAVL
jgi:hypothetical protein